MDSNIKRKKDIINMILPDVLLYEIITYTNYNRSSITFIKLCIVSKQWERVMAKMKLAHKKFYDQLWYDIKQNHNLMKKIVSWWRYQKYGILTFNKYFFRARHIITLEIGRTGSLYIKDTDITDTDITDTEKLVKIFKKYFKKVVCYKRHHCNEVFGWYPLDRLIKDDIY